jgi:hypothetical protein
MEFLELELEDSEVLQFGILLQFEREELPYLEPYAVQ